MIIKFSTKARTLIKLKKILNSAKIAPLFFFNIKEWKKDEAKCLNKIKKLFQEPYIVRSSFEFEDNLDKSNAGNFLSLLNINNESLEQAVKKVISTYSEITDIDEVLVQPMLKNVVRSGVAFSHDPNTCAPYRMISWLDGEDTTAVTSGAGGKSWQEAARSPTKPPYELKGVISLLNELLRLFDHTPLDCEFAVTQDKATESLWLLQVRPLILSRKPESEEAQTERLQYIRNKIQSGMSEQPFLLGNKTVYGVMPDWNPAEIIGIRPKPLALSLYQELVTDSIWAYQRHNYGYRNLRSFPLMQHFVGMPYIDLRLSFNSFIPADLDEKLGSKLVNYYLSRLLNEPSLHDKIEFDIVFSCYTFEIEERLKNLSNEGFTKNEQKIIAQSLLRLTNRIIDGKDGLWIKDFSKINILNKRREKLKKSNANLFERIYWLLEDVKRYGTLPFAGLARAGFIAVQILKSLVKVGIFSEADYDAFVASITTVSSQLSYDRATLSKKDFISRYGHLRPGTYDILSPRYDEKPDLYFDWSQKPHVPKQDQSFSLTPLQSKELQKLLNLHRVNANPKSLMEFLKAGIELRELSKFHFTENLSDALELIKEYGTSQGLNAEELSYCNISVFKEFYMTAENPKSILINSIEKGKTRYKESSMTSLPPLIVKPDDVWSFYLPDVSPNFITQKQITAPVASSHSREFISKAVVCIPSADPGFDWLFSYPIAGLITAWGGANSHMAIRAGELGLPAVIGAGEKLYDLWSKAQRIYIDCAGRYVEVLE